ncbi:cold-shock protein [Salinicola aestuarinus]|uniref:cold-shock protein n=1 Tax=Salinicola aestuarinus TaxID=1949082 RepID=UPI000DA23052|nr:cold shock domain-containing protein [Salinicola aestuarinus]
MNSKTLLRCTLISLLLSIPSPLLIGLVITLISSMLAHDLTWFLDFEGVSALYAATVLAVFIILLLGTLAVTALAPQKTHAVTAAMLADVENDDRELGEVKWFNVNKGYGFITRASGEDVFVHFRAIRGKGHRTLAEGQKVRYYVVENDRGLQADDVTVIT